MESRFLFRVAGLALPLLLAGAAIADNPRVRPVSNPLWQQECGSCHLAYPPALLPATSWTAVMDGLSDHFGNDASLATDEEARIRQFLAGNSGKGSAQKGGKPLLRITETPWFVHEHSEELPASVWKRKEIGSPGNCAACHAGAANGRFNEHDIRIPGGGK